VIVRTVPAAGGTVTAGDQGDLEAVVYVPAAEANAVREGFSVQVTPSIVRREEFGFIRGRVTHVASFPASVDSAVRAVESQGLAQSLLSGGPVTEVRVRLERNAATPSGFAWSSGSGPDVKVSGGTLCEAQVVMREQAPISLVIPY